MYIYCLTIGSLLVKSALAVGIKSFVYIVPDGYGPASQTLARDYASLLKNGENPDRPVTYQLAADQMVGTSIVCQNFNTDGVGPG
jgi:alkaline phosphatase